MPGMRLKTKYVFCFTNRKITSLIAGRTSSWAQRPRFPHGFLWSLRGAAGWATAGL